MIAEQRQFLNAQADRIEAVLAAHKVRARVAGGDVSPRWVRFEVETALGSKITAVQALKEELALALGAPAVRIARQGSSLAVEVPRDDPQPVRLLPLLEKLGPLPPLTALLGMAGDGRPLLLRLPSPEVAHVLVAGTTGSGKTALLRSLAFSLAARNRQAALQLLLIDPKGRGLAPLGELPHALTDVVQDSAQAVEVLAWLVAEMERRDAIGHDRPHIVVLIDELGDLLAVGGREAEGALQRVAARGRESGIHLLAGTQKPSSTVLSSLLKANFPVRLVGRVASAEDARVAAGVKASGAERLLGRGDFVAVAAGGVTRFQAAYAAPDELAHAVHCIAARAPLAIEPPAETEGRRRRGLFGGLLARGN
jgi:S-DNA-T family DNA segregation ATPase FtsK/SpoIIIE